MIAFAGTIASLLLIGEAISRLQDIPIAVVAVAATLVFILLGVRYVVNREAEGWRGRAVVTALVWIAMWIVLALIVQRSNL